MDSYAAGLIDGEGYIGIQESGGSFQTRLKVTMSDKGMPALLRMQQAYGGKIDPESRGNPKWRDSFTWRLTGQGASRVIETVRPWLMVKAEPADLALEFQSMVDAAPRLPNGRATWTDEMRERARVLVARIQEANRRGPDPLPPILPSGTPVAIYRWGAWWEPEPDLFGPVEFTDRIPASGRMVAGHIYSMTG